MGGTTTHKVGPAGILCMGKRNPRRINKFVNRIPDIKEKNFQRMTQIRKIESKSKNRKLPEVE